MALSAADPPRPWAPALLKLLAPTPGRTSFASRLGLICALTALVTEIYQTPEPALAVYIVFFLNRDSRAGSLITNVALLVVISLVIGIVFLVAMAVGDDAMWRVVSIATISFALLFLGSASKLRPLASTLALVVGYALDLLGSAQLGEEMTRALLYGWLFVGIPAAVSLVVNLALAPSPRRLAERRIAEHLRLAAAVLRHRDATLRLRLDASLREGIAEIEGWLKLAGIEGTPKTDIAALRQAALSTIALLSAIDIADRTADAAPLPVPLRESIAETIDKMAEIVSAGGYPLAVALHVPAELPPLAPVAAQVFAAIEEAILGFAEASEEDHGAPEPKAKEGFFAPDALTNPDHVRYALKTTGAAMFCYVLYSLLDWPGIHTCFLTCYIVSLTTTAESVEKLVLRIAGCVAGAAIGTAALIFLVPSLTSIGSLMMVVFLGAFGSGYIAVGSPRIAYAGFQIAFAFFLCVIQGTGPSFDMATARDRVIGILLGNVVMYLVSTNLWPVSLYARIDPAIARLLRQLGAMVTATSARERRTLAAHAQTGLGGIESDLALARYEPAASGPSPEWVDARRASIREIAALESPLLLAAGHEFAAAEDTAARLEALAARFDPGSTPGVLRRPLAARAAVSKAETQKAETQKAETSEPLVQMIDHHISRLDVAAVPHFRDAEGTQARAPA